MFCRLDGFLYFWTLRQGAIVAAAITAIIGSIECLLGFIILAWKNSLSSTWARILIQREESSRDLESPFKMSKEVEEEFANRIHLVLLLFGILCIFYGIFTNLNFLLLAAAIRLKIVFLTIPWMVKSMIDIISSTTIFLILTIVWDFKYVFGFCSISFQIYLWIVVYNFRLELKKLTLYSFIYANT